MKIFSLFKIKFERVIVRLLTGLVVLNGAHGATGDPILTFVDNGLVIDRPE